MIQKGNELAVIAYAAQAAAKALAGQNEAIQAITEAIWGTFRSYDAGDYEGEPKNVVDALATIAIALNRIAERMPRE